MADLRLRAEVSVEAQAAEAALDRLEGEVGQVAAATRAAGPATREAAAATRDLAQGATAASAAQAALRAQASDAARVLRAQGQAAREAANAQQAATATARQSRAAYQQLGFQVQDVAAQAAAGTSAFVILAQQGGQVAASMIGLGGAAGRVAAFIAGPFGAALLGVVTVLGLMATRSDEAGAAKGRARRAAEELTEAQRALQAVLGRVTTGFEAQAASATEAAARTLAKARADREAAQAAFLLARANQARADSALAGAAGAGEAVAGAGLASFLAGRRTQRTGAAFADAAGAEEGAASAARRAAAQLEIERATRRVEAATDAAAAANQRFETTQQRLRDAYQAGRISVAQFEAGLTAATRARDAELERGRTATRQSGEAGAARRAEAEATRAAAQATRELESAYSGIVQTYLPLKAAEEARLRRLADIARLERAGRLSAAEAATAREGLSATATPAIDRAQFDAVQQLRRETEGWLAQLDRDLADAPKLLADGVGRAGRDGFDDFAREGLQAIDLIAGAVGGTLGGAIRGISGVLSLAGQVGASRASPLAGQGGFEAGLKSAFRPIEQLFTKALGPGSSSIGAIAGKAAGGAAVGAALGSVTQALGIRTGNTGASIGGAVGGFLPIPGGPIIGGLLGGIISGLFQTPKKGSATLSTEGGAFSQGAVSGNSRSRQAAAQGLLGGVIETLDELVAQFGGQVGRASVSVGQRGDTFRVDTSGQGRTKVRGSGGLVKEFQTEAEAVAFATLDALRDGAVTGLSAAVARALTSSTSLEAAVSEALKVQDLETLLGGFAAGARKAFADFERQARERVRVATDYGFDLVELERITGEQRARLLETATAGAVGSLQRLLDELKTGSRFEGSILDQRAAIQAEIATLTPRAQAGEEGAADRLAELLGRLDEVSKEAFGTAGAFATDRSAILVTAQSVVDQTTARLRQEQEAAIAQVRGPDATAAKLDGTNALLDEANGQNAQMIAALGSIDARLKAIEAAGGFAAGLGAGGVADFSLRLAQRF